MMRYLEKPTIKLYFEICRLITQVVQVHLNYVSSRELAQQALYGANVWRWPSYLTTQGWRDQVFSAVLCSACLLDIQWITQHIMTAVKSCWSYYEWTCHLDLSTSNKLQSDWFLFCIFGGTQLWEHWQRTDKGGKSHTEPIWRMLFIIR